MTTDPGQIAIVLLSGGLDSATMLAIANNEGFSCYAVSFDYGQRHRIELNAAQQVASQIGVVNHRKITLDLRAFGRSALTDDIKVPKDRDVPTMRKSIPLTYVPARNTIFLSYALAMAEVIGSSDVFIGVNAVDYSGYPDCRPEYIRAFEQMANLATQATVEGCKITIHTPLMELSKTQIIERGLQLNVDYSLTHSCYDPDSSGNPCLRCDACLLRIRAFEQLGMTDPIANCSAD